MDGMKSDSIRMCSCGTSTCCCCSSESFSIVINRRADVFGHFVEAEEVNFQNKNPISNGNILWKLNDIWKLRNNNTLMCWYGIGWIHCGTMAMMVVLVSNKQQSQWPKWTSGFLPTTKLIFGQVELLFRISNGCVCCVCRACNGNGLAQLNGIWLNHAAQK